MDILCALILLYGHWCWILLINKVMLLFFFSPPPMCVCSFVYFWAGLHTGLNTQEGRTQSILKWVWLTKLMWDKALLDTFINSTQKVKFGLLRRKREIYCRTWTDMQRTVWTCSTLITSFYMRLYNKRVINIQLMPVCHQGCKKILIQKYCDILFCNTGLYIQTSIQWQWFIFVAFKL